MLLGAAPHGQKGGTALCLEPPSSPGAPSSDPALLTCLTQNTLAWALPALGLSKSGFNPENISDLAEQALMAAPAIAARLMEARCVGAGRRGCRSRACTACCAAGKQGEPLVSLAAGCMPAD